MYIKGENEGIDRREESKKEEYSHSNKGSPQNYVRESLMHVKENLAYSHQWPSMFGGVSINEKSGDFYTQCSL